MKMQELIEDIKNLNVLIVEDDDDIREIMSTPFGKICNTTRTAVDGEDGLKQFKENKPDIIITDIRMPNMNGNEMIEKIKEIDPSCPIVVVSGHGKMIRATDKADVILEKPIKFDKLIEQIHQLTR
ncbi:MAG: response regulator [Epsilonproteobacteria bacterium]|nr:MAG: response regulator [Campylobacterota bacterium]